MLADYFSWYYSKGFRGAILILGNFLKFFWHFFSIGFLSRRLFSPWKKDITFSNWRGIHPVLFFKKIIDNGFSRIIGFLIRSLVIILGISIEVIFFFLGLTLLIFWILLPALLIFSLIIYFSSGDNVIVQGGSLGGFFFSLVVILVSIYAFKFFRRLDLEEMTLDELAEQGWFLRVWNRMGFLKEEMEIKKYFSQEDVLKEKLNGCGLKLESFYQIVNWEKKKIAESEKKKRFWDQENLYAVTPIGRNWSFGYTVELDKYAKDLQKNLRNLYGKINIFGHEKDVEMAELILSRPNQNSLLLVGDPGVGKKSFVNFLAKRIAERRPNDYLDSRRLMEMDLGEVVASTEKANLTEKLNKIFYQAAFAGNVVLVIHNIHEFLNPEKPEKNISALLADYLAYPSFQLIGTLSKREFNSFVEKNQILMKNTDKIIFEELSSEDSLKAMLCYLEEKEKARILVTYQALEKIINFSNQYIFDTPLPEKAIDALESILLCFFQDPQNYLITVAEVDKFFSDKFKVSVGKINEKEKNKLLNLEKILHKRIVGQAEAISQISEAMRRARSGIGEYKKPLGSFLFLGPTGVGKTETAKALAEAYFGSEEKMIRIDMSEYQTPDSVDRFVGSERTNERSPLLVKISESHLAVVLFDEIEKAHPDILNLFLQLLDEGWLTDISGQKVFFNNSIIIATSNTGAEIIKEGIEQKLSQEEIYKKIIDQAIKDRIFRPEFLNRFEKIIFFESLKEKELVEATRMIIRKISDRVYESRNIKISFSDDFIAKIIQEGYDPIFGMRSIKRFAQDKIEDVIARNLISGAWEGKEEVNLDTDIF
ncbi:AAA family ATPase [Patescibacteria group bacterium]|nr:AAA family ATPase [Patescibacteria group bacterium]